MTDAADIKVVATKYNTAGEVISSEIVLLGDFCERNGKHWGRTLQGLRGQSAMLVKTDRGATKTTLIALDEIAR